MPILRTNKRRLWCALVLCFSVAVFSAAGGAQQTEYGRSEPETGPVEVFFLGYDKDDIIFRIINNLPVSIVIKGLSYRQNILYRPVIKDASVGTASEADPFKDVVFRSTGDFIWSENHKQSFRLMYRFQENQERQYAKILDYPERTEK